MTETQTKSDLGLPRWPSGKESTCNKGDARDTGSIPGSERSLEKEMATNSSILAWEIPWTEAGYSPWGHKESDTTRAWTQLNNLEVSCSLI